MPNIRTYKDRTDGLQLDDRASRSAADAARTAEWAAGDIGHSIASIGRNIDEGAKLYDQHVSRQQISNGLATSAHAQEILTGQYTEARKNADPNDHTFGQTWVTDNIDPFLEDWQNSFSTESGKQWASQRAAQMREHFIEKVAADDVNMAGVAAVKNIDDFTNASSRNAHADPSAVPSLLGTANDFAEAVVSSDPHMTAEQAGKVKTTLLANVRKNILQGGFYGMAEKNPDAALAALDKGYGANDLDAKESRELRNYAEQQKNAQTADQRAAVAAQKAQRTQEYKTGLTQLRLSMYSADGNIIPRPGLAQQVVQFNQKYADVADPGEVASLMSATQTANENQINHTTVPDTPAVYRALASRIGVPVGDPNALTHAMVDQAYADHKLSNKSWSFLNDAVEKSTSDPAERQARTDLNEALARLKPAVDKSNPLMGKIDLDGVYNYDRFYYDAWQKYQGMVASGMSPGEAIKVLTDPRNPQGLQQTVPAYQKPMSASVKDIQSRGVMGNAPPPTTPNSLGGASVDARGRVTLKPIPTAPPPRKEGESAADYLKRTGK